MSWQNDLPPLFNFLQLRMDWPAQSAIRVYGDAMAQCVQAVAPLAFEAFEEHILFGGSFSRSELGLIRRALDHEALSEALSRSIRGSEAVASSLRRARPFRAQAAAAERT